MSKSALSMLRTAATLSLPVSAKVSKWTWLGRERRLTGWACGKGVGWVVRWGAGIVAAGRGRSGTGLGPDGGAGLAGLAGLVAGGAGNSFSAMVALNCSFQGKEARDNGGG